MYTSRQGHTKCLKVKGRKQTDFWCINKYVTSNLLLARAENYVDNNFQLSGVMA